MTDLYEMKLDGKELKLLIEDVTNFTMATNKQNGL
jgi:hypothetical protein